VKRLPANLRSLGVGASTAALVWGGAAAVAAVVAYRLRGGRSIT
jgi:hypothetical protein